MQKDGTGKDVKLADLQLYGSERVNQAELDIMFKPCQPIRWT
jgi:hypothetical protein